MQNAETNTAISARGRITELVLIVALFVLVLVLALRPPITAEAQGKAKYREIARVDFYGSTPSELKKEHEGWLKEGWEPFAVSDGRVFYRR